MSLTFSPFDADADQGGYDQGGYAEGGEQGCTSAVSVLSFQSDLFLVCTQTTKAIKSVQRHTRPLFIEFCVVGSEVCCLHRCCQVKEK